MQNSELTRLFERYLNNECSPEEVIQLLKQFDIKESESDLKEIIRERLSGEVDYSAPQHLLDESFIKIKQGIHSQHQPQTHFIGSKWFLKVAAAILLIVIPATIYFVISKKNVTSSLAYHKKTAPLKDILPGHDNATLTLADGTTIVLDSVSDGAFARQNGVKVLKLNGQIIYKDSNVHEEVVYNQIATAKGNQYQLILTDGTKVWLNAASSIRFPSSFTSKERKVEITGEAYFEVAKDVSKPFKVLVHSAKGSSEVEVLGTHFNINAYDDEEDVKTTLLEGAVKVKNNNNAQLLLPGQQAVYASNEIAINKNMDADDVIAWKQGFFVFDNTDLKTLMRQVARWYDVDVELKGLIENESYSGKISRNVPLSKFLQLLQLNNLQVKVEGRKIVIMQ